MSYMPSITSPPAIQPRWRLTAPGAAMVIDIDEIKTWVNRPIEDTFFDAEITSMAMVAQAAVERYTQIVLAYSTWVGTIPRFYDRIAIMRRPFVSLEQVDYVANDGTITTVDPTLCHAMPDDQDRGILYRGSGVSWPSIATRADAVRIRVKAGYAVTSADVTAGAPDLPYEIKHAILMTIAALDASHGDSSGGGNSATVYAMKQAGSKGLIPREAATLLAPYFYRSIVAT